MLEKERNEFSLRVMEIDERMNKEDIKRLLYELDAKKWYTRSTRVRDV